MIFNDIKSLVNYGIKSGLITEYDRIYTINQLIELFKLDEFDGSFDGDDTASLDEILKRLCDYAYEKGIIEENTVGYRDLFDTKIMGILTPKPSEVVNNFNLIYKNDKKAATDYFYKFSQDTNYIRRDRIAKDLKWITKTQYGDLVITINLSKPEKDPKAIAAAKNAKQSGYPKCQLCYENEGYAGRINHPARQNHRIIPIEIMGEKWGFQYSPYVYYNEHCIVFNKLHTPMKIDVSAFKKLFDFVRQFPHYFIGSNADLPIVGGSILSHEHFQGGNYSFPMAEAPVEYEFTVKGYEDISAGIVKWPMSVIRIKSSSSERLTELADLILNKWRNYTDEGAFIFANTDSEPHNTITPIARMKNGEFEMDLVLRNNITTKEHPLGVFHPHAELHHIKKENIGLIEVMGMAILPARLKSEMSLLANALVNGEDVYSDERISKHADWSENLKKKYKTFTEGNVTDILHNEIGIIFEKVLEDAGVYKRSKTGKNAFLKFIYELNK